MRKILVIRFSSLGDIILTIPVLRALKFTYPQSELCMVVKEEFADLIQFIPWIDRFILFNSNKGIRGFLKLIDLVRDEEFDLLVDLHSNTRSKFLTRLIRATRRVKYSKLKIKRYLRIYLGLNLLPKRSHITDFYFKALEHFPLKTYDNRPPYLKVDSILEKKANAFLKKEGISDDDVVVGLAPGSKWATKRWNTEKFALTGDRLIEMGIKVIMLGGPDEVEIGEMIDAAMREKALNLVGNTSLVELIAIVKRCNFLITNDSSLMHISAGLGNSVIALFGPTTLDLGFGPIGEGHIVLSKKLFCRPCSSHGGKRCWRGSHKCMERINVDEVMTAIKKLLRI